MPSEVLVCVLLFNCWRFLLAAPISSTCFFSPPGVKKIMCSLWLFLFKKKKSLNWLTAPSFGTKWCCSSNADISEVAAVASVNRFSQFWKVLNYFSIREFYSNYLQRTQASSELFWLSWFVWIYWTPVFQCYTYRTAAALPALKKTTKKTHKLADA